MNNELKINLQLLIDNYMSGNAKRLGYKNICIALRSNLKHFKYNDWIKNQRVLKSCLSEVKGWLSYKDEQKPFLRFDENGNLLNRSEYE